VVAWTGGLTAVFAGTIAITQTDIKKVLAYSTVSQLGYMFMAAGCGGYSAAIFHLGTHAFFKALLFLGSGAVILAMHHEQDIEKMGGLWRRIPGVHWVFLIGVLAIAGFPGMSGFFSKDEILVAAFTAHVPGHAWLYWIGLLTAGITAYYMFRLHIKTFWGESRAPAEVRDHMEEPVSAIMNPLWVLAFFSIFAGWVGLPQVWGDLISIDRSNSLANFLAPALAEAAPHDLEHSTEYWMAMGAVLVAGAGALLAWWLHLKSPGLPERIASAASGLYRLLRHKYYVDELYDAVCVRPLVWISDRVLFRGLDAGLIDGAAVGGTARVVVGAADRALKYLQTGLAQSYILLMIVGACAVVGYLIR
jgi:NADH-quinone oxidoreductase subunit L